MPTAETGVSDTPDSMVAERAVEALGKLEKIAVEYGDRIHADSVKLRECQRDLQESRGEMEVRRPGRVDRR